jgi:hypothetical protein
MTRKRKRKMKRQMKPGQLVLLWLRLCSPGRAQLSGRGTEKMYLL